MLPLRIIECDILSQEVPLQKTHYRPNLSDESAHDFEKAHLPATAWPPTGWYVSWAKGRDVFEVSAGSAPNGTALARVPAPLTKTIASRARFCRCLGHQFRAGFFSFAVAIGQVVDMISE